MQAGDAGKGKAPPRLRPQRRILADQQPPAQQQTELQLQLLSHHDAHQAAGGGACILLWCFSFEQPAKSYMACQHLTAG